MSPGAASRIAVRPAWRDLFPIAFTRPPTDRPASWRASLGPVRQARLTAQLAQHGLGAVGDDPIDAGVEAPLDVVGLVHGPDQDLPVPGPDPDHVAGVHPD